MQQAVDIAPQDPLVRNNMAAFLIRQGESCNALYIVQLKNLQTNLLRSTTVDLPTHWMHVFLLIQTYLSATYTQYSFGPAHHVMHTTT